MDHNATAQTRRYDDLRCPQTGAKLRMEGEALVQDDSSAVYPIREGVPILLSTTPIESQEDADRLTRSIKHAQEKGYRDAVQNVYARSERDVSYVLDENRSMILDLLPIDKSSVVLEIGASMGQMTVPMARRASHLHGIEVVAGQAGFAQLRCDQCEIDNVTVVCGGDECRLPYRDEMFDVVTINLVLEWCFGRNKGAKPHEMQQRLLRECYRVLRPGGKLFVNTKNRFSLAYVIGKGDEHAHGLRFGNALPRFLMRLLLKLTGRPPANGYLYSYPAIRKECRAAGFESVDNYWTAPEMRYPTHVIPVDSASVSAARRTSGFRCSQYRSVGWLLRTMPAGLVRYFTPGLAFIADKAGPSPHDS